MTESINKKIIPWIVAAVFFIEMLDVTIIGTAIPRMAHSLAINPISLKAAVISYLISLAVFIPISGWLADKFGSKRLLVLAVIIFTVGSVFCGLSQNLEQLVIARVIQGLGGALMTPMGRLTILRTFAKKEIVRAMNYVIIPSLVGSLMGPFLGGVIVTFFSWRWIFFINVPFGICTALLVLKYIPNFINHKVARFDWVGFLLLGAGLGGTTYAVEGFGEHVLPMWLVFAILAFSISLLIYAYYFLRDRDNPVIDFSIFKIKTFRVSIIAGFFMRVGISSIFFLLPLMYQLSFGWLPIYSGLLILPVVVGSMAVKSISHKILVWFGMKRVLLVTSFFLMLSIMQFSLVQQHFPIALIVLMSFLMGGFSSLFYTAANSTGYSELEKGNIAKCVSILGTVQRVSTAYGVGFGALLLTIFAQWYDHPGISYIGAYHWTFFVMGSFLLVPIFLFMTLPRDVAENVSGHKHH